jgi:tyrosine-protein kinase Etk/Wzc
MASRWFREARRRRVAFAVAALAFAVLSLFPEHFTAEAQLLPQDSGGGLTQALATQGGGGGLLSLGALLGNKQPVEADLTIARSHAVLDMVLDRLKLVGRPDWGSRRNAEAKLKQTLGITAIRGSILQIITHDRDPTLARELAATTADAIQDRLGAISLAQAAQKRVVATDRLNSAAVTLARAQDAITRFRTANKLAAPPLQLGAAVENLAGLEGQLQAKQVEIASLQAFAGDQNIKLQAAKAELAALQRQVDAAKVASKGQGTANLAGIALANSEYFNLYRDERAAQILYEVYKNYLEEVAVDELSANQNLVLVEPAYLYPERQFNVWAVAGLIIVFLLAFMAEYYIVKPPVGQGQG